MLDDARAHAEIWDADEQARDFADQAFASLLPYADLELPHWKQRRVLDFGAGTGLMSEKLAPLVREVVAVDISQAMLDVLCRKGLTNVDVHCANIDKEEVRANAPWLGGFDLIVASCVCGILPNYQASLELLANTLNPDGVFAQWDWLITDPDDDDGLRCEEVETAFSAANLTTICIDRAFEVLFDADQTPVLMGVALKPTP